MRSSINRSRSVNGAGASIFGGFAFAASFFPSPSAHNCPGRKTHSVMSTSVVVIVFRPSARISFSFQTGNAIGTGICERLGKRGARPLPSNAKAQPVKKS
jgi:hypothetical protein